MNLDYLVAKGVNKEIYRDGDKVIKLFDENFSKSDILNEALNQARVEETGLMIPKLIEVTTINGKWAIVSEFIEGKTLAEMMKEDSDNIEKYLDMFVDIQLEIHSKKSPLLNKLKDKMKRKLHLANIDPTIRYELCARLEAMPKHDKVCHGDFNTSNIIITKDNVPYVIDWSHATQGNASADAARSYLCFCLEGKEDIAKLYLKKFCQKSDTARQYVQGWFPIVAASQSVKNKPEEKELLNSWIDVVDYE